MRSALTGLFSIAAALSLAAPAAGQPTMDQLWPSQDGLAWSYDQHSESFGVDPQVRDNRIRIYFDGVTVAPTGIQAQYLRHQVIVGRAPATGLDAMLPDPFFRRLWVARPDLRDKILQRLNDGPCPEFAPAGSYSVLLSGEFAYLKTSEEIAAWRCNLANTRSWQWLVSDLTIGNTFTLQLVPDLASDVYLRGTIAAIEPASLPMGTFDGCVRVDYLIDYGTSECTDQNGTVLGSYSSETRGYMHYAPNVGPVQSFEEFIPFAQATGSCVAPGQVGRVDSRATLRLFSAATPARATSWGRIKAAYR